MLLQATETLASPATCVGCGSQGASVPRQLLATGFRIGPEESPVLLCLHCAKRIAHAFGLLDDGSERHEEQAALLVAREKELEVRAAQATRQLDEIATLNQQLAGCRAALERSNERDRSRVHDVRVAIASLDQAARED